MKRLLIAIAAVAAIGLAQTPATGDQTKDAYMATQIVNVGQIREHIRDRIRERFQDWYRKQVAAFEAVPVVPEPTVTPAPPAPAPETSYPSGVLSAAEVASYARGAGFPESVIDEMVAIAYRESRFNPGAINSSSGACGLTQIFPAQPGCLDPARNMEMAYAKYQASGLAPWGM